MVYAKDTSVSSGPTMSTEMAGGAAQRACPAKEVSEPMLEPHSVEYYKGLYEDMGSLYRQEADRLHKAEHQLEQAQAENARLKAEVAVHPTWPDLEASQARVTRLEESLRRIRQLHVTGSPTRHIVEAALAEGDDRSGKYPAWDQNEAP